MCVIHIAQFYSLYKCVIYVFSHLALHLYVRYNIVTTKENKTTNQEDKKNMKEYILVYEVKKNYERRMKCVEARDEEQAWRRLEGLEKDRIICQVMAQVAEIY